MYFFKEPFFFHAYIIVGVQHAGNVLCQISVQNSLDVITHVDYKNREHFVNNSSFTLGFHLYIFINVALKETAAIK